MIGQSPGIGFALCSNCKKKTPVQKRKTVLLKTYFSIAGSSDMIVINYTGSKQLPGCNKTTNLLIRCASDGGHLVMSRYQNVNLTVENGI